MNRAGFPALRLRRTRRTPGLRALVRQTRLSAQNLVLPLFVRPGRGVRRPIGSMPGQFQLSVDEIVADAMDAWRLGIRAVMLFGIPTRKDSAGSQAWAAGGIVQQACRALKKSLPDMTVITDLCFCEYTTHGHCGVVRKSKGGRWTPSRRFGALESPEGRWALDNDATLRNIARTAVSQARAGSDVIAPSGMIDGAVGAVRRALDAAGFSHIPIMSYSAKYASAFYGPFRDAAGSAPRFGGRASYQMDPANSDEALREIGQDVKEGADIIMVKPALAYLDVIRLARDCFKMPIAAYNVSGEYSMVKAAASKGWIDGRSVMLEMLLSIRRAGADIIITYFAREAARELS